MKNYLEKRREELKKRDGGFTLMEMLIVVAIIAVLIAIAIPVFTSQLERSRDATSVANMRSAYAEAQAAYLTEDDGNDNVTITKTDGVITKIAVANVKIESQVADEWSGMSGDLPFTAPTDPGAKGDMTITFTYNAKGSIQGTPTLS